MGMLRITRIERLLDGAQGSYTMDSYRSYLYSFHSFYLNVMPFAQENKTKSRNFAESEKVSGGLQAVRTGLSRTGCIQGGT